MTDDRPTTAFGKNVAPVAHASDPRTLGRLRRQAADFLRTNDPTYHNQKRDAARKRRKDQLQAEKNPALVRARQKALRLSS